MTSAVVTQVDSQGQTGGNAQFSMQVIVFGLPDGAAKQPYGFEVPLGSTAAELHKAMTDAAIVLAATFGVTVEKKNVLIPQFSGSF